jgi:hypothetical protein
MDNSRFNQAEQAQINAMVEQKQVRLIYGCCHEN